MRVERDGTRTTIAGSALRLHVEVDAPTGRLEDAGGEPWAELRWLVAAHPLGGPDETLGIQGPVIEGHDGADAVVLTWTLRSSRWAGKRLVARLDDDGLVVHGEVDGTDDLLTVELLGGPVVSRKGSGVVRSGRWFRSLVSGGPTDPSRVVRSAREAATIGVASGSEPGRGGWFFTPGPFVVAGSRSAPPVDGAAPPAAGPWLGIGLDPALGEARFTTMTWDAVEQGWSVRLAYDGKTRVAGTWRTPPLVLRPATDPYAAMAGIARRRAGAASTSPSARRTGSHRPAWWAEPMFCGWGAQCALARAATGSWRTSEAYCTQAHYDGFLDQLEARGIVPGTITIDDRWEDLYGSGRPDPTRWPDLRGWIADRHARGQRVLLWMKAWEPAAVPVEACVVDPDGRPLTIDPEHPLGEAAIRAAVRAMLAPDGLDADGCKIDFTASTPAGVATRHHGEAWGVELLRRLLDVIAEEARSVKPEALLVGHTPNPLVAEAVDMLRLNDAMRLDDPEPDMPLVAQMTHRAAIVRAVCPDHLIDTDDWCVPDRASWRAYAAMKGTLGVPALYVVDRLDRTLEPLEAEDHELIRRTWAAYRAAHGLPARPA